jgi:hypothetical protein
MAREPRMQHPEAILPTAHWGDRWKLFAAWQVQQVPVRRNITDSKLNAAHLPPMTPARKNEMKNTAKPGIASFDSIATGKQYDNIKTRFTLPLPRSTPCIVH